MFDKIVSSNSLFTYIKSTFLWQLHFINFDIIRNYNIVLGWERKASYWGDRQ